MAEPKQYGAEWWADIVKSSLDVILPVIDAQIEALMADGYAPLTKNPADWNVVKDLPPDQQHTLVLNMIRDPQLQADGLKFAARLGYFDQPVARPAGFPASLAVHPPPPPQEVVQPYPA